LRGACWLTELKVESGVKRTLVLAAFAAGLAYGAVAPGPALAAVSITVNPDAIAFGYSDGYWDREHQWHRWPSRADAQWYRSHYKQHYYTHRHDRDHDQGWHESDRWWNHG